MQTVFMSVDVESTTDMDQLNDSIYTYIFNNSQFRDFFLVLCAKKRRAGGKALLFLILYAGTQVFWESMRQDAVLKWGFVRANQLFSGIALLIVLILCWCLLPASQRRPSFFWKSFAGLLLSAGLVMVMEFALEQKIGFLTWMRMDLCYLVMAFSCLGLIFSVLPVWKKAFPARHAVRKRKHGRRKPER